MYFILKIKKYCNEYDNMIKAGAMSGGVLQIT